MSLGDISNGQIIWRSRGTCEEGKQMRDKFNTKYQTIKRKNQAIRKTKYALKVSLARIESASSQNSLGPTAFSAATRKT